MTSIVSSRELRWKGRCLYFEGKIVGRVIPDEIYPGMWRVRLPDGSLSDLGNLTRVRDAAMAIALRDLNHQETPSEAPYSASIAPDVSTEGLLPETNPESPQ
jgi:hypothetical protein